MLLSTLQIYYVFLNFHINRQLTKGQHIYIIFGYESYMYLMLNICIRSIIECPLKSYA